VNLSITSDYIKEKGNPEPYLEKISRAGFTHIHWCHHWNTDFIFSQWEIDQIGRWLNDFGLKLNDLHATAGVEKSWGSLLDFQRKSGVDLILNRIRMAAALDSDVIILHTPREPEDKNLKEQFLTQIRHSLDDIQPEAQKHCVKIALENLIHDNWSLLQNLYSQYDSDFLGLCYDSGHGNVTGNGLDQLESLKHRLISVHLHDNDGTADQHRLIFDGTVDWERLANIMSRSTYQKPVNMEVEIHNTGIKEESLFLAKALETGAVFSAMIDAASTE
jgi:sugar phosphate isomerase/epimerase